MSIWSDKPLINKWIEECCLANNIPELVPKIRWRFNNRFRARMGDAHLTKLELRFSVPLWGKATPEQKENTVKHEAAHLITFQKYGKVKSHGEQWRQVMLRAGQQPTRTHSVKSDRKTIDVICTGCKMIISMGSRRYARMRNGQRYLCKGCNSPVEFIK